MPLARRPRRASRCPSGVVWATGGRVTPQQVGERAGAPAARQAGRTRVQGPRGVMLSLPSQPGSGGGEEEPAEPRRGALLPLPDMWPGRRRRDPFCWHFKFSEEYGSVLRRGVLWDQQGQECGHCAGPQVGALPVRAALRKPCFPVTGSGDIYRLSDFGARR